MDDCAKIMYPDPNPYSTCTLMSVYLYQSTFDRRNIY